MGEDTVGHFDLGIFVASIVPNGPADRDGRIRPGRERFGHFYFTLIHNILLRFALLPRAESANGRGDRRGVGGVVTGLWGYLCVQRWFWGLQTTPLLDTGPVSFWPLPAGGRLISLNHISLEGVTFSEAAEVIQSSPEEVQLIISQPKGALRVCLLSRTVTVNLALLCWLCLLLLLQQR